jgi:hydroxymethylpyrimidine pyrophosphatase-like HAD family hydrolase
LNAVGVKGKEVNRLDDVSGEWLKIVFCAPHDVLEPVKAYILQHYAGSFHSSFSHPLLLETQDISADKGVQVAFIAERLGVQRVFCVGDGENDLPMLRRFPSFAPSDAVPAAKATAGRIVNAGSNHAVAHAIELIREVL